MITSRSKIALALPVLVLVALTSSCAAGHASTANHASTADHASTAGHAPAATQAGPAATPTMWLYTDDTSVALMTWTPTGSSSGGLDFTATISGVSADAGGLSTIAPQDRATATGHLAGNDVTLTANGQTLHGTIDGTKLVFQDDASQPPGASADADDSSDTEVFTATTKDGYDAAVSELRSQGPAHALDATMKSDLRIVATNLETAAVDAVPYVLSQHGDVITVGEGMTAQLEAGDTVTMKLTPDGQSYCLIMSNPATSLQWIYTSGDGAMVAAHSCPGQYSVDAPAQ